jgi:hypothetical protein
MLVRMNLIEGPESLLDLEGIEVANMEEARLKAIETARDLMADAVRGGILDITPRIDIADDTGNVVMSVSFGEVVTIRAG